MADSFRSSYGNFRLVLSLFLVPWVNNVQKVHLLRDWTCSGKLLPRGLFGRDQLTLLLHLLDSELEMSQAKEFLDRFFPGDEDISCDRLRSLPLRRIKT